MEVGIKGRLEISKANAHLIVAVIVHVHIHLNLIDPWLNLRKNIYYTAGDAFFLPIVIVHI